MKKNNDNIGTHMVVVVVGGVFLKEGMRLLKKSSVCCASGCVV